ncbi:MAG: hypothetical protein MJZ72_09440 [Bacteroidales bacterium]|nr:hypothetical protein [Bacteroidales bacterium]
MQSKTDLEKELTALTKCLQQYKLSFEGISCITGPTYNLYKIIPKPGDKVSKFKNLQEDFSVSLGTAVRVITLSDSIGIEIPHNKEARDIIKYIDLNILESDNSNLPVILGSTIYGETVCEDLTNMSHLLLAGATKQGKTNSIRSIIAGLIQRIPAQEVKFALFDTKGYELQECSSLFSRDYLVMEPKYSSKEGEENHCISTTVEEASSKLSAICMELESRYETLSKHKLRNIETYQREYKAYKITGGSPYMPYIVVIIDEVANLVLNHKLGKEILSKIVRIAAKGRCVGIHMIISTQRPSFDVISGIIKANFPSRLAFRTSSRVDSITILDCPGAEKLTGNGDALYSAGYDLCRVQTPLLGNKDFKQIIESKPKGTGVPYYLPFVDNELLVPDVESSKNKIDADPMIEDAAKVVILLQKASTSLLQQRLGLGFARASRIMDQLEELGIVGRKDGRKPREILVSNISELKKIKL